MSEHHHAGQHQCCTAGLDEDLLLLLGSQLEQPLHLTLMLMLRRLRARWELRGVVQADSVQGVQMQMLLHGMPIVALLQATFLCQQLAGDARHGCIPNACMQGWDPQGVFANAKPLAAPGQDLFAAREARRAAAAATAAAGAAPASASSHPAVATPAAPSSAQAPQPTQQAQEQAPPKPPPSPEPSPAPATAAPTSVSTNPVVTPVAPREWARPLQGFSPQVAAAGGVAGAQDDPVAGYSRAAFEALLQSSFMGVDLDTPGLRVLHMVRSYRVRACIGVWLHACMHAWGGTARMCVSMSLQACQAPVRLPSCTLHVRTPTAMQ